MELNLAKSAQLFTQPGAAVRGAAVRELLELVDEELAAAQAMDRPWGASARM